MSDYINEQIEILEMLKNWESRMGGFDAPVWSRVNQHLEKLRKRRDAEDNANREMICPDCGSNSLIYVEGAELIRRVMKSNSPLVVDAFYEVNESLGNGRMRCEDCDHEFIPEMAIEFV